MFEAPWLGSSGIGLFSTAAWAASHSIPRSMAFLASFSLAGLSFPAASSCWVAIARTAMPAVVMEPE